MPDRVRDCGWFTAAGVVEIRTVAASVYPAQLIVCGRPWLEPVCSAKIRMRKSLELAAWVEHHKARGGSVTFAVLTAGDHHLGQPFDTTMGVLRTAWVDMTRKGGSWPYNRLRAALDIWGNTQAYEMTHGDGWHPHINVLWWHGHVLTGAEQADMVGTITRLWSQAIAKQDRYLNPRHGLRVLPNATDAATGLYVAKVQEDWGVAAEMTQGTTKTPRRGSRLPFGILADHYRTGDLADWQLWDEYRHGVLTGGERSIALVRNSPGLARRLGVADQQAALTDEQLAAIEVGGALLGVIPQWAWKRIRMRRAATAMLEAAEAGGLAGLNTWLVGHGLPAAQSGADIEQAQAAVQLQRRLRSLNGA